MTKDYIKLLIAVFFISLHFLKGAVSIMPTFFSGMDKKFANELVTEAEQENEKKNTEDRPGGSPKEFYFNDHCPLIFTLSGLSPTQQNIAAINILYKQTVYLSIPTPPPKYA